MLGTGRWEACGRVRGDEGDLSRGALGMPIVNLRPVGLGPLAGS
ncbi:hypothetical protein HMPREF1316_1736 [Olsenella profusa F0195]|uniref:Uncharacterized protein n=1 Tax=Olsenella profusa F0195 TaxID=1125712 RepID=U2T251_9ACTN|nr:hypothetical protein HMPREF1316_1736 [Olsenella profusa F0195]